MMQDVVVVLPYQNRRTAKHYAHLVSAYITGIEAEDDRIIVVLVGAAPRRNARPRACILFELLRKLETRGHIFCWKNREADIYQPEKFEALRDLEETRAWLGDWVGNETRAHIIAMRNPNLSSEYVRTLFSRSFSVVHIP